MRSIALPLSFALLGGCSCNDAPDLPGADGIDPGRVVLHRLNRAEYDNTVRDLLGTTQTPAADLFPYDDSSHGFDNLAATLTVSPLHVEMYERAADELATEALAIPIQAPIRSRFEGEGDEVTTTVGGSVGDGWMLWSNGDLTAVFDAPESGRYALRARLWATQAGPDLARAALGHDGWTDDSFDVAADSSGAAELHEVEVELTAGVHSLTVSFLNDFYDPANNLDRNLVVDWVESEGPLDATPGPNPIREMLLVCEPASETDADCARQVLDAFVWRAWRRPTTAAEIDGLVALFESVVDDGGTWDDGMRIALQAVLLSPHFLYRVELDPDPATEVPGPISDWEMASRLSYFLWSTLPDEALFTAAATGQLHTEAQIAEQVRRMLDDPKAEALTDNFAGQWLYIRGIDLKTPDAWEYPGFDDDLRASMTEEMQRFFRSFVEQDRDLHELLTATEGEIDARLAAHYGYDGVTDWTTVDLSRDGRGGLLGMAGLLMVNSYPARTSPVLRGKWVLSNLLCSEPPPPPAGVEGLVEDDADAQTLREQLEAHRADPVCASCHDQMDPIGLGLEHFDGIGAYRDTDNGFPVDASGTLPDGTSFYGARELSDILATDPRLDACIVEKAFTYGLGRSPLYTDAASLEEIEREFTAGGSTFEALAVAIATSAPFTQRHGEEP